MNCPTCGQGTWFISRPRTSRASERRQGRWCWRSDVVQHRPCRPIRGLSAYTDSIETSTDNLTLHRGHRDDQCGSSSCPEPARTEPSGLSCGSGPGEGRPGSSGSGQGCPGSPGTVEDRPGSLRSVEGGPGSSGGCSLRAVKDRPGSLRSVEGGPGSSGGCSLRAVEDCPGSSGGCSLCAVEGRPGSLRSVEGGPGSSGGCSLRSVEDCPGSPGCSLRSVEDCPGSSGGCSLRSVEGCPGSSGGCSLRSVEDCPGSSGGCSLRSVEGGPGSSGGCSLRSVEDCPGSSGSGQGSSGSSSGCSLCSGQGRSPILSKSFSTSRAWSFALILRDQAQFVLTTDSQATCLIPGHVAFAFAAFGPTSTGQEGDGGTRGRTRLEVAQSTSRWGRSAGSIRGSAPPTGSSRYFVPPRRRGSSGSLAVLENAS